MNILDGARLVGAGNRPASLSEIAMVAELSVPVVATGFLQTISDIIEMKDSIDATKSMKAALKKISAAVQTMTRASPPVAEAGEEELDTDDDEESRGWKIIKLALRYGIRRIIKMVARALFRALRLIVRYVIRPLIQITIRAVTRLLPLLFTPEGAIIGGIAGLGWLGWKLYEHFKKDGTSTQPPVMRGGGTEATKQGGNVGGGIGAPKAAEVDISKVKGSGIQNNNPGNLRAAGQPGQTGKSVNGFAIFGSQAAGLYNASRQIQLNGSRGYTTITELITRWAPPTENVTKNYIAFVSDYMGMKPDAELDFKDKKQMRKLLEAIITFENGSQPYSSAQLDEAVDRSAQYVAQGYRDNVLAIPVSGTISSLYGKRNLGLVKASKDHKGIDIGAPLGTDVYAADDGTVAEANEASGYGNVVGIKHEGLYTKYGHMGTMAVKKGDVVKRGQKIGEIGNLGVSTGPHLHFEVLKVTANGMNPDDPLKYLPGTLGKGVAINAVPAESYGGGGTTKTAQTGTKEYVKSGNGGRMVALNT